MRKGGILLSVHADGQEWATKGNQVLEQTGAEDISSIGESKGDFSNSDRPTARTEHVAEERMAHNLLVVVVLMLIGAMPTWTQPGMGLPRERRPRPRVCWFPSSCCCRAGSDARSRMRLSRDLKRRAAVDVIAVVAVWPPLRWREDVPLVRDRPGRGVSSSLRCFRCRAVCHQENAGCSNNR
jgi:hypothetical protein